MAAAIAAGRATNAFTVPAPDTTWMSRSTSSLSGSAVTTLSTFFWRSKSTGKTPSVSATRRGIICTVARGMSAFESFSVER